MADSPPLLRQLRGDLLALGRAARSKRSAHLRPRTADADRVVKSICPYCAVGCAQDAYVKDERIIQIEGDPDSPISRGRLCPKGSASMSLVTSPSRATKVRYRRPHAADWEDLELDVALDMIADRVVAAREQGWQDTNERGAHLHRTLGFAHLGGATLDNEENYLIKKFFSAMGAVQIETRPAYDTPPRFPVWGPRSGAAVPPTSSRTCRTPTALSSRAQTWPSVTPSASSG